MFKRMLLALTILLGLSLPAGSVFAQHEAPAHDQLSAPAEHAQAHETPSLLPNPASRETLLSALWVVIIFVILLIALYPTAWKSVLAGLKAREDRIRKDIAEAEAARLKAEATLRDYNAQLATAEAKVRDLLAKAAVEGESIAANLRVQAQQEADAIKERATKDIEVARKQAVAEVYEQTANLATSIAEKILRRNLNPDDQRDLVKGSLEQLQQLNKN